MSAPLSGGFSPGDFERFAVDGDFTFAWPCGAPRVTRQFAGDSIFSYRDIVYGFLDAGNPAGISYQRVSFGVYPNLQIWAANQSGIILEQEFMVSQAHYIPPYLNTPYNPAWSVGWSNPFANLLDIYLVREGPLEDMGGGISRFTRAYASLPRTRNVLEQFAYHFIGFGDDSGSGSQRQRGTFSVPSRLQYDYFIFDDLDILGLPVFPLGPRLNVSTGALPDGIILQEQRYLFGSYFNNVDALFDDTGSGATTPTFSEYLGYGNPSGPNGGAAELIAEASVMRQWMGNIYERVTRFVKVQ